MFRLYSTAALGNLALRGCSSLCSLFRYWRVYRAAPVNQPLRRTFPVPLENGERTPNGNPRLRDYTYLSDYPGQPTRFYGLEQDSFRGRSHALPVFQELKHEGLTFVFYDLGEILDFVLQVSEGLAFCHERLVAHLDVSYDNILVNFAGANNSPKTSAFGSKQLLSDSNFPVRYYMNDFEHAAVFSEDSKPSERTITGLPNARWNGKKEYFTRRVLPEMGNAEPYCPFRADVWSLGGVFQRCLGEHLLQFSKKHMVEPKLWDDEVELHRMEIPTQRPLMTEVYETLKTIIRETDQAAQEHDIGIYLPRDDTPTS
ncbi:uncharacterized protein BT62DRAFT_1077032 [Guyanagaster necrorhizus]|uniref:Protein kinase domain-containing protein n=1 Tax=Guyanagaster necrorhizus TaxID=856835 RepID=A0A9P7VQ48_9AGAR|nr:uncharacterized protein BT62DRAFT_1077032 [Guyanagaster necrorhizus MCA 3950]KAG7445351.1 hypothetical protein BT62DRAFT_1077032 [Guyanagaster necrorhizus MCA 3950]